MSQDAFGNYYANIQSAGIVFAPDGELLSGAGAPSGSIGDNGSIYVDTSTGDLYTKSGDVWTVFSGGGGGATQVLGGSADPTNSLVASGRAVYLQSADVNGDRRIYTKNTTGSNNTDWVLTLTYQA